MFTSRKPIVALGLVASLLLAGCGAPAIGTLAPVSKVNKTAVTAGVQAPAPSVSVKRGPIEAGRQVHVPMQSSLLVAGSAEMAEDEVAELADSLGFDLLAESTLGTKFSKSGLIRSTETGFALVTTTGLFKKKETVYNLTGSPDALSALSASQNKKALVKGVLIGDTVTVATTKKQINFASLFNVFTKGKVVGHVVGTDGKALADVKVAVKSDKGFTFSALSNAEGEYEIKGLEPGKYDVTLAKDGFQSTPKGTFEVKKRHSVKLEATLAAVEAPAADETAAE
ncbi:MAG: carboxypeptidase-like regulatory domain-containing protein [Candidatus Sericytochromatia bacterium]